MTQEKRYLKALPVADPETQEFWDGCKRHKLLIQRCKGCSGFYFWPRNICPHCHSHDVESVETSGKGKVHTFSVVRQNTMPGWRDELPYIVAIVEIDDAGGTQMMTNLVDCDPDQVKIGMPVEAAFDDVTPEVTLPKFKPA